MITLINFNEYGIVKIKALYAEVQKTVVSVDMVDRLY